MPGGVLPEVSQTPWQRLPAELAAAMRPGLPATVTAVAGAVTATIPAFATLDHPKVDRDVQTAVRVAMERFLDLVGVAEPALPPQVREVFVALGAAEAREQRGPQALLAALRTAARLLLRTSSAALAQVRPVDAGVLIDLADAVSAYVDELVAASTDGFARQLREQAGEGDRRRSELAQLLLRGDGQPAAVAAAAAAVGWRTLEQVVAVLLPADQARDARFRYGADGVVAERGRDAVLLLRAGPRATRRQLTEALAGRGAVVAPALDWPKVPEAVRLADAVADLVGTTTGGATTTTASAATTIGAATGTAVGAAAGTGQDAGAWPVFADDHLATLVLRGNPLALAVLSGRRLAPLAHLRAGQRDSLLATLHSWLRHWGSRSVVAAELYIHPQTVSYRLRRLRELLGGDLDDPTARFELHLVLASRSQPSD